MNENLRKLMLKAGYPAPELAPRAQTLVKMILLEAALISVQEDDTTTNRGEASAQAFLEHFGMTK